MNSSARPNAERSSAISVDDLRLHRDVERRDRLIGHDEIRLGRERARDGDALALAAGELVRQPVCVRRIESDLAQELGDARRVPSRWSASSWIRRPSAI